LLNRLSTTHHWLNRPSSNRLLPNLLMRSFTGRRPSTPSTAGTCGPSRLYMLDTSSHYLFVSSGLNLVSPINLYSFLCHLIHHLHPLLSE
jgi:hypothetical protein